MHGTCYSVDPSIDEEFFGKCKNGVPSGMGFEINTGTENVYHGHFENQKHSGFGVYYEENGMKYEGTFKDGKPHGFGLYREKYEANDRLGEFKDGTLLKWL